MRYRALSVCPPGPPLPRLRFELLSRGRRVYRAKHGKGSFHPAVTDAPVYLLRITYCRLNS